MKKLYFLLFISLNGLLLYAQTSESFSNIPTTSTSSYLTRNWTGDNSLPWTATDARTDQTMLGQAICIRNGLVKCDNITGGVATLSLKYQQVYSGTGGILEIRINGTLIDTAKPTTTVATKTFTGINVTGNFNLEIKQVTPGLRIIIDSVAWTNYTGAPCVAPTTQAGTISFGSVAATSMSVSFAAAAAAPDQYLVVMSTSATLGADPVDGTTYAEDDVIGSGTVVYKGSSTSFNTTDLLPGTKYYFYIFSVNSNCTGGPLYLTASPANANQTTVTLPACAAPSGGLTNAQFTIVTSSSINGSITAPVDADGYLVCMSTSSSLGFTPANGTAYSEGTSVGSGTVIKFGGGTTFSKSGLAAATQYYFTFFPMNHFSCTGGPLYNTTALQKDTTTAAAGGAGIPAGYYDTVSTQTCAALKSVLKWRTTQGMTPKTYGALWSQYAVSDVKPGEKATNMVTSMPYDYTAQNVIWDIYSDKPGADNDPYEFIPLTAQCGTYSGEAGCYNREHSIPQSWFGGSAAPGVAGTESDYLFIFPTDGKVNAMRGNYIYGEVAAPTYTSLNGSKLGLNTFSGLSGTAFEPIDEYKGDLARAFFYFVTRYEDKMPGWSGGTEGAQAFDPSTFPSIDIPYLKLMLKWHQQDPVSQKEKDRNNGAYAFQGNRNPYIDHPEYVDKVWNSGCTGLSTLPVDLLSFKSKLTAENNAQLEWKVANEVNMLQYEVERSFNGTDFYKIVDVKASGLSTYTYVDDLKGLNGRNIYYRLKEMENSGDFKYSAVTMVTTTAFDQQFSISPNPLTVRTAKIQFARSTVQPAKMIVSDISGRVHQQFVIPAGIRTMAMDLTKLPAGMYLFKLLQQDGNYVLQKIQLL